MKSNGRVFICAGTGGGKTALAAYLTLHVPHLAVFDVKRELGWLPLSRVVTTLEGMTWRGREVFYPPEGMEGDEGLFNRWCQAAYNARNVMIWLDESAFVSTPNRIPSYLKNILVAGRTRGVGVIALTQSAVSLSHPMLWRGAEDTYIGYSTKPMIDSLAKVLGPSVEQAAGFEQYSGDFIAYLNNAKKPVRIAPVPLSALGKGYHATAN